MFSEKSDRNVIRKKIRSISEGNFQSCYASNKAEKFKLYRLSQGIDSCAQAQALKIRKEEKELKKALDHLEAEKHKHATERKLKQAYFKFLTVDLNTESNLPSNMQNESLKSPGDGTSLPNIHRSTMHSASTMASDLEKVARIRAERNREVTPFYMEKTYHKYHQSNADDENIAKGNSPSKTNTTSNEVPTWKKESTKPIGSKSVTFDTAQVHSLGEMVEHRKNSLSNKNAKTLKNLALLRTKLIDDEFPVQKSSKNLVLDAPGIGSGSNVLISKLGISSSLRLKPQSSTVIDKKIPSYSNSSTIDLDKSTRRASSIVHRHVNENPSTDSNRFTSTSTLKSENSSISNLESKSALFSRKCSTIPSTTEASFSSFLTPLERQELNTKIYRNTTQLDLDRRFRMLNEAQKLRRQTLVHENKAAFFKNLLKAKMIECADQANGEEDVFFQYLDAYDDGKVYPAYRLSTSGNTMDDYRALRKCRYLRLSNINWESLKAAVLETL